MKTADPTLFAQVAKRVQLLDRSRGTRYPEDYWKTTTNQHNELYWGNVAGLIYQKYPASAAQRNDVAFTMATDIIWADPAAYLRHVGAHLYGGWASIFKMYSSIESYAKNSLSISMLVYDAVPELKENFSRPKGLEEHGSNNPNKIWNPITSALNSSLNSLSWLIAVVGLVLAIYAFSSIIFRLAPRPILEGAGFCFLQVWGAFLLVALTQPAIGRYIVVWEPLIIAGLVLFAVQALAATRKFLVSVRLPLRAYARLSVQNSESERG
jgi:hypothetical protein